MATIGRIGILVACVAFMANLAAGQANTLTKEEEAAGWVLLFDGKSLNGWHKKDEKVTTSSWVINDSAIHRAASSGGNIYSPGIAESFELSIDWKIKDENGNSGVWLRMMESVTEANRSGPEIQICGKQHADYSKDKLTVGACYMMYQPNPHPDQWVKPAGQWNTFKVVMNQKHVEHWGNGVKMVEYEIGSPDWISRQNQAADRIKNPRYGEVHYGNIVLTDHQTLVWYRNIKMRPLAGTTIKSGFPGWNPPSAIRLDSRNAMRPSRNPALSIRTGNGFLAEAIGLDGKRLGAVPAAAGAWILPAAKVGK